jgi:dTDP-4-dehydrorhamnose 3,5-epimerase
MVFRETPLKDALLVDPFRREDERGFFARLFCKDEFAAAGIER